ncbi:MAG: VWA domain-containing protein [Deltaproteobacteria bacterium]|nr:VWA domain-containing protein [Deltaproteobacteria bacterium]
MSTGARGTRPLVRALAFGAAVAALAVLVRYFLAPSDTLAVRALGWEVEFVEPRWFYLLVLLPYLWLVRGESLTDFSWPQQVLSVLARSLVVTGLLSALARPTVVSEENKTATVFLVDVSESISDAQLSAAQAFLDEAWTRKGKDDLVSLITLAKRPLVIVPDTSGNGGTQDKPPRLARHREGSDGTDIQAALQLAYGLYPPGYLPRAVIVSDGNETSGDLLSEAYRAQEFGVRVSFEVFPEGRVKEIRAVALHLPEEVKVGAPFEVVAEVWSTHEEEATLSLRQDDLPNPLEPQKIVKLHEGQNRVSFRSEAKVAGFTSYKVIVKPREDQNAKNNETVASVAVKGRPRVLYIEGEYERMPLAASYLKRALDRENIDVDVRGPRGVPTSSKELARYDLLLLSDVPSMFLGLGQAQAIESYVRDLGGGFIMAGGEDSFGSGGYQGTRIERILPVRFDGEKELRQPQVALALVIDRSGSMSGEKIEMAKESARATAEVLDPQDLISVVAFDNQPTAIVRLQKASNRMRIAADIARLQPGGGTNILPALQEAFNVLAPANAKVKHVILLSDGQAAYEGIAEVCDEMRASRITVSAVGVGDADRNLLALVAEHGEGRMYMAENASELPKIFMKETQEVQKSSLVEETVTVHVVKRVEMIEGTSVESAPALRGYVSTKPKPLSEVILVSDRAEPLLARWRVGLGSVVAWTSDVKNRWAADWLTWPGFPKFWAQVIRTTMRHKQHESYDLGASVVDGLARVVVDAVSADDRFVNDLETTLEVIDPRDSKVTRALPMAQSAAGRYEAEFPVDRYGTFLLRAVHSRDGHTVAESVGAVALPYPTEYLRSTPNEQLLAQVALVTGGQNRPAPDKLFQPLGDSIRFRKDLWPHVLLGVAVLFLIDVYLRRVRFFGYRALGK